MFFNLKERELLLKSKFKNAKVEISYLGEHHMGAMTVVFELDRKFRGVGKFRSTNGNAEFDDKAPYLIIYDSLVILLFDYDKKEVYSLSTRGPEYFSNINLSDGILRYHKFDRQIQKLVPFSVDLCKNNLQPGYGPVLRTGKMPSAYP
jgi:hypothetical protein